MHPSIWKVVDVHLRASMNSSTVPCQYSVVSRLLRALTSTVVHLVGLLIFARRVCLNGLLDRLDSPAQEVGVAHVRAVAGLHAAAGIRWVCVRYVCVARVRSEAEAWCNGGGAVGAGQSRRSRACSCLLWRCRVLSVLDMNCYRSGRAELWET
jgi:hypothetical protein